MAQSHAALILPTQISHKPEKWKGHTKAVVTIGSCQRLNAFMFFWSQALKQITAM